MAFFITRNRQSGIIIKNAIFLDVNHFITFNIYLKKVLHMYK